MPAIFRLPQNEPRVLSTHSRSRSGSAVNQVLDQLAHLPLDHLLFTGTSLFQALTFNHRVRRWFPGKQSRPGVRSGIAPWRLAAGVISTNSAKSK